MDINKEQIDDLNAVIKVKVEKDDYQEKVEGTLREYRKKANMPGFRPGKVPMGIVKKMYEKPVMLEEINKVVSQSLTRYIVEEKLDILGEPLPSDKEQKEIDWDNQEEFEFAFDIGIYPGFEINISQKDKLKYYDVQLDEKTVDSQVEHYTRQHGSFEPVEEVKDNELVKGSVKQVLPEDAENEPLAAEDTAISLEIMKDDEIKKKFQGAKAGDKIVFDIKKAYPNDTEIAGILKTQKEEAANVNGDFEINITEVDVFKPAGLNQELFDKIFGEGNVNSEEEMREKIKEDIKPYLDKESENKLMQDIREKFLGKVKMDLPKEFLKRWIKATNEKINAEEIEKDFPKFEEDIKWQLIKNKIAKENEIKVEEQEILDFTKQLVKNQYMQYGIADIPDEQVEMSAKEVLKKEEEARRVRDQKMEEKVINFVKENIKIETKKVSMDEYQKLAEKEQEKKK